ncbi:short-chain dehydrogenase [Polymorphobacter multimanifer]|uniref:SDR family NAD(P)-dependent oxidoreductase n=1 Tax=Polymorphobacter multimanifer TaxID=1070431 RepID=UPI0019CBAFF6|nr:SDR family NAD(P)-dependent oxidoreductase [Polymorphobacter multimanifer]GGI74786.1 short-chain dehydrogenase [Polymorphobacter multimanifer]
MQSVAIVGAGDFIGAAIARRFAAGGYAVHGGRRGGGKLAPLPAGIAAAGGGFPGHSVDARSEESVAGFLDAAEAEAPLAVVIFNVGANVQFPLTETSERVFRTVGGMACYGGFLTGREAARRMLPRGAGSIFCTGATASMRGGAGFAAFASAKAGLRAVAQSMARELGPQGLHVAHLVIDAGVDTEWVRARMAERGVVPGEGALMNPASIAEAYWQLHAQPRDAWTHEMDLRPFGESF